MNKPKEPKRFEYPRMYYQNPKRPFFCRSLGNILSASDAGKDRLRIIYPDGICEYQANPDFFDPDNSFFRPCWAPVKSDYEGKFESGKQALIAMRKFDEKHGFGPAIFIGEIK